LNKTNPKIRERITAFRQSGYSKKRKTKEIGLHPEWSAALCLHIGDAIFYRRKVANSAPAFEDCIKHSGDDRIVFMEKLWHLN
jgi:hypothetical protein